MYLRQSNLLTPEALSTAEAEQIAMLIKPSGFYNTKAQRVKILCSNILSDFGTFKTFQNKVDRRWLLAQKGIGMESADAILCYGCKRNIFVVDSYTQRLLDALGLHFEEYMQIQTWAEEGIEANFDEIRDLYAEEIKPHAVYARFHGKIVEYAKEHIRGKYVDIKKLKEMMERDKAE